jgi:hypothetical protein
MCLGASALTGCTSTFVPAVADGPANLVEACSPSADVMEGGPEPKLGWHPVVQIVDGRTTFVLFVSGKDKLFCEATRGADGGFGNATIGLGEIEPVPEPALTFEGSRVVEVPTEEIVVYGRVPGDITSVEIVGRGGLRGEAVVGDGFYLGRLQGETEVVEIVARDPDGATVSLSDPDGLEPGATPAP